MLWPSSSNLRQDDGWLVNIRKLPFVGAKPGWLLWVGSRRPLQARTGRQRGFTTMVATVSSTAFSVGHRPGNRALLTAFCDVCCLASAKFLGRICTTRHFTGPAQIATRAGERTRWRSFRLQGSQRRAVQLERQRHSRTLPAPCEVAQPTCPSSLSLALKNSSEVRVFADWSAPSTMPWPAR